MFESILAGHAISLEEAVVCMVVSIVLGLIISAVYMFTGPCSKNFAIALALLPVLVQIVIMTVNGNIGTGIAVVGVFGLVRFRSIPGNSREILGVFFAMAVGLATGTGVVGFATFATVIIGLLFFVLNKTKFGEIDGQDRDLKIIIPENLEYAGLFEDIFATYTAKHRLESVKTTNLGSMFELRYKITMKSMADEKKMIDEIRVRNGNLTIMCGRRATQKDVL